MTKKILISLAVVAALALGVLYGKGLLSVHQGFQPPASLSVLVLEKQPKSAPEGTFVDERGAAMRSTRFTAAMCFLTYGPPGAGPALTNFLPWPVWPNLRRGSKCSR